MVSPDLLSPDLPYVIRHRPLMVLSLVASGSRRLGPWCACWSDPSRNACPFLISGFPEFAQGVGYGVHGTPSRRFVCDQHDIDGNVSGSCVGLLRHLDLIRHLGNNAAMVHGDVLSLMSGQ